MAESYHNIDSVLGEAVVLSGGGRGAGGIVKQAISVAYVYDLSDFVGPCTYVAARACAVVLAVRGRRIAILCVSFWVCSEGFYSRVVRADTPRPT